MSVERLKYVTKRRDKNGVRWYWQRKGFPLVRLAGDPVKRFKLAHQLNDQADKATTVETVEEGTLGWVIERYRDSDGYKDLKPTSKKIYARWLSEFCEMWGQMPPKVLTRRVVVTFAESIESPATRKNAITVLKNVLERALYYGLVEINQARKLRLKGPKPRQVVWSWDEIERFPDGCDNEAIYVTFYLMLYLSQRPGDVSRLRWPAYNGDTISLKQEKTGKLVEVPVHRDLRPILEKAKARRCGVFIVAHSDGRPVNAAWITAQFAKIRRKIGLEHVQGRDLRRTAVVLMGEAGCTEAQIAAVTGHDIETTRQILETYLPRTLPMARAAIKTWEDSKNRV